MNHLLVIRLSALGDAAIAAPVVHRLAAAYPALRITVAAPPMLEPLFGGMDNLHFLGVEKKQRARDIYCQLRSVDADAVADLHGILRVRQALTLLWFNAVLHGRLLPVHHIHKGRLSRWATLHHLTRKPRRPQWQRYIDVMERLGLAIPDASLPQQPLNTAISPHDITIGIAPFAQHAGKIWPWEHTSHLALMLAERGYQVLLFGSRNEAPRLEALAAQHGNITSLAGKHTFREELDIIRSLSLMVSMDSANLHFASAVGTPVVSIWGATHPDIGFYGFHQNPANALCANLPCQPCSVYGNRPCRYGDYRCLKAITPEQVLTRIETLCH